MEGIWVECKECKVLPPEIKEYSAKACGLCGELHCEECLNEAGYCTPCSEATDYSKDEAIPV